MRLTISYRAGWIVVVGLGMALSANASSKTSTKGPASKHPVGTKSYKPSSFHHVSAKHRRARQTPFRYRLAHLQMSSGRIEEIQSALAREGYYQGVPNGKWDDSSRAAMRQCQAANGFDQTGLPDAKSLMRLGLGPHPLPLELDPMAQSRVSQDTAPKAVPGVDPASTDKNQQPNNPNNQN
jgi:peptidoglycan hydrolase-like protein with peptidoglycan-binding domain